MFHSSEQNSIKFVNTAYKKYSSYLRSFVLGISQSNCCEYTVFPWMSLQMRKRNIASSSTPIYTYFATGQLWHGLHFQITYVLGTPVLLVVSHVLIVPSKVYCWCPLRLKVLPCHCTSRWHSVYTPHPAYVSCTNDISDRDANSGMTWPSLAAMGSCGRVSSCTCVDLSIVPSGMMMVTVVSAEVTVQAAASMTRKWLIAPESSTAQSLLFSFLMSQILRRLGGG